MTVGQVAEYHWGMSLRDWFAGMAMQAIWKQDDPEDLEDLADVAVTAYQMADAMMEARKEAKQ